MVRPKFDIFNFHIDNNYQELQRRHKQYSCRSAALEMFLFMWVSLCELFYDLCGKNNVVIEFD